jgi:leucine efflux protein
MFGIQDYWAFVLAVIIFLAIPGPGNLALVTSTSQGRLGAGFAATAGLIAGDQILMWLAVAGVAALLATYPIAFTIVQYAGALYLIWLGIRMLRARAGDAPVLKMEPRRYFRQAFVITLLNPKAIVFYMSFFPLFIDPARHQGLVTFAVMAATIASLTLMYCSVVVFITHFAAERLRASPRIGVWLNRLAGMMLIAFGIKLVKG